MHILYGMKYDQAKVRTDILKALAHPVRMIVLDALKDRDLCVNDLLELVVVDQSTLSRHLAQLKKVGIVSERKEGVKVIHHLACPCILDAFGCAEEVMKSQAKRWKTMMSRKRETNHGLH